MRKKKPRLQPRVLQSQFPDPRLLWWNDLPHPQTTSFCKYAQAFISREYWRVSLFFDQSDLQQEAYLVFLESMKRYYWVIHPGHMMALYKKCLYSHFVKLSYIGRVDRHAIEYREEPCLEHCDCQFCAVLATRQIKGHHGVDVMELRLILQRLPDELFSLLQVLLHAPSEVFTPRRSKAHFHDLYTRETTNEIFCRIVGVSSQNFTLAQDLLQQLRKD